MVVVTINEVPVTVLKDKPQMSSARINCNINRRSTASLTVWDPRGELSFEDGDRIEIRDDYGNLHFAGLVTPPVVVKPTRGIIDDFRHMLTAADWHQLADRHYVSKSYPPGTTTGEIVLDVIADYLAADGVTVGTVDSGVVLPGGAVFDTRSCTYIFDLCATLTMGYIWYIDYDQSFYFVPISNNTAPWNIVPPCPGGPMLEDTIGLEKGTQKYRNYQWMKGGKAETSSQPSHLACDGTTKSWVLAYPLAREPEISIGGVTKTVGILNVETGKDFYWTLGSDKVSQDGEASPLPDGTVIDVLYIGQIEVQSILSDANAIIRRAQREGTSGRIEAVDQVPSARSSEAQFAMGNALLAAYCVESAMRFTYETRNGGLASGMLQPTNYPKLGIVNKDMLIETIDITFHYGCDPTLGMTEYGDIVYYAVQSIVGPVDEDWTKFFKKLVDQGDLFNNPENTGMDSMAYLLLTISDSFAVSESASITISTGRPVVSVTDTANRWTIKSVSDPSATRVV